MPERVHRRGLKEIRQDHPILFWSVVGFIVLAHGLAIASDWLFIPTFLVLYGLIAFGVIGFGHVPAWFRRGWEEAAPPAPSAPVPAAGSDAVSQLERIAKLKEQGLLTDDEFQVQKAKVLSG